MKIGTQLIFTKNMATNAYVEIKDGNVAGFVTFMGEDENIYTLGPIPVVQIVKKGDY